MKPRHVDESATGQNSDYTLFFISIKLISILRLRCLKNKHILSIFSSIKIFLIAFISSQIKCKEILINIRIKLVTRFRMLKRPLQCSCQMQYQTMKWVLKLIIPSSIISGSNWENLKHIGLQPNLPVCLHKKSVYWQSIHASVNITKIRNSLRSFSKVFVV